MEIQGMGTGKQNCSQHTSAWLWPTRFTTPALLLGVKCCIHKSIMFVNHCQIKVCCHSA